jgi:hypothetical protein
VIELHHQQGTPEWLQARAGVLTASDFTLARLKPGAKMTDSQANLAFAKAWERITEKPMERAPAGWAAERGHDMEPFARIAHEAEIRQTVRQVGLVLTDDFKFGASADGLIGDEGGAEYKCFVSPVKLRPILINNDFSTMNDQVQGGLWITRRQWWDMCLFCPDLDLIGQEFQRHRANRDESYIEELESDLWRFMTQIDRFEEILRDKGRKVGKDPRAARSAVPF